MPDTTEYHGVSQAVALGLLFGIMGAFLQFKNKKVLIMGLGFHGGGVGATKFFARQGAQILVTDLKPKKVLFASVQALEGYPVKYVLGRHRKIDFRNTDYIFKGPDVPQNSPYLAYARRFRIPILERTGLFLTYCPATVIGITGTKGKSTTASLLASFLQKKYKHVWLLGTPQTSILEALPKIKKSHIVVAEFSSFELEDLRGTKRSPHVAIITSLFPEHLNRHRSFAEYARAKASIFRYQKENDHLIVPRNAPWMRRFRKNEIPGRLLAVNPRGYSRFLTPMRGDWTDTDLCNMALAIKAAELFGVTRQAMKSVLRAFRRLPGRREVVRTLRGVTFINDTTATNPTAALHALEFYGKKRQVVAVVGGSDKNLEVHQFARALSRHAHHIVFLPGKATERMKKALSLRAKGRAEDAHSMPEAVQRAFAHAAQGDIVLLSPGAASFGLFQHEFDRGDQFARAVKQLRS